MHCRTLPSARPARARDTPRRALHAPPWTRASRGAPSSRALRQILHQRECMLASGDRRCCERRVVVVRGAGKHFLRRRSGTKSTAKRRASWPLVGGNATSLALLANRRATLTTSRVGFAAASAASRRAISGNDTSHSRVELHVLVAEGRRWWCSVDHAPSVGVSGSKRSLTYSMRPITDESGGWCIDRVLSVAPSINALRGPG